MMTDAAKTLTIASGSAIILSCILILSRNSIPTSILHASNQGAPVTTLPAVAPSNQIYDIHSPDGTKTLVLVSLPSSDGSITYAIHTSDVGGANAKKIYALTLGKGSSVNLSPNSWSPDNAFVYFTVKTPGGEQVLIVQADGTVFGDGQTSIDLAALFGSYTTEFTFREVTGWDAPGLLHVFTYNADGTKGPAFWFDVASRSFIELANS